MTPPLLPETVDSAALRRSLQAADTNVLFARAVVEAHVDGTVWASESAGAEAVHIVHPYGMSLVWGEGVGGAFDEIVRRLRAGSYRDRDEWLQIDPRWHHLPWGERLGVSDAASSAVRVERRVGFAFDRDAFERDRALFAAPPGWTARPAVAGDYFRSGSVVPAEFWRSAAQFLGNGGGWVLERGSDVGALAFSSFRFDDLVEIGIETAPDARGRGLATAAAAHMIGDALERGLTPVWSCREGNAGSLRLALKLGFVPRSYGPYFGLPALPAT